MPNTKNVGGRKLRFGSNIVLGGDNAKQHSDENWFCVAFNAGMEKTVLENKVQMAC